MKKSYRSISILLMIAFIGGLITSCTMSKVTDSDEKIEASEDIIDEKKDEFNDESYIIKLKEIGNAILDNDKQSPQEILDEAYGNYGNQIENIYFADATGKMTLTPPVQLPDDYDARERSWYQNALENEVYHSKPYEDLSIQKNMKTVAKALYKHEQLIGVIAIDYELEENDINNEQDLEVKIKDDKQPEKKLSEQEKEKIEEILSELKKVVEKENNFEALKEYFNEALEKKDSIQMVYLANSNEIFLITPYVELPDNYNPSIRPWYELAIKEDIYISETYIDATTNKAIVTASIKIALGNESIGVLAIDYHIE